MQPFSGRASHPEKSKVLSFYSKSVTRSLKCPKRGVPKQSRQSGQSAPPIDHIAKFRLTRGGQLANVSAVWVESAKKRKTEPRQFSRLCISWQPPLGGCLSLIYKWPIHPITNTVLQKKISVQIVQMLLGCRKCPNICDGTGCLCATTPHSDQHSNSMDGQMAR